MTRWLSIGCRLVLSMYASMCLLVDGLHMTGSWRTSDEFLHFLVKFGFQRTNQHDRSNTQGYIYGNVTARTNSNGSHGNASSETIAPSLTFVVVDKSFFNEYYGNRSASDDSVCQAMFNKIDTIAFDSVCRKTNKEDFLRRIPCPKSELCPDEDRPELVVPGSQFTYGVQDINQPRFWYVSMVACHRVNCTWTRSADLDVTVDYDIWLVNGNPFSTNRNPFKFQFSFEKQDLVEMYLVFLVLYLGLVCVQAYVAIQQRHAITHLFTATISFGLLAHVLHLAHLVQFSADGRGNAGLDVAASICDVISQTAFVLVLLLLAKGWAITHRVPKWKFLIIAVWSVYLAVSILLYAWGRAVVNDVDDVDLFQTWPGGYTVFIRLLVMLWFLYELRRTMLPERSKAKLQFLLHFGASSLVWFIYLPVLAVVAINMSALWRFKFVVGISSSVNFLAFASMTHLLWPVKYESYMHLSNVTSSSVSDELEEFNEAPHVINQGIRHERT